MNMELHLKIAEFVSDLLDNKFEFFGKRFGLDPVIGLVPLYGDLIGLLFSLYLLWIGKKMFVPKDKYKEMVRNVFVDSVLAFIPVLGDILDFSFRGHYRNVQILREYGSFVTEGDFKDTKKEIKRSWVNFA